MFKASLLAIALFSLGLYFWIFLPWRNDKRVPRMKNPPPPPGDITPGAKFLGPEDLAPEERLDHPRNSETVEEYLKRARNEAIIKLARELMVRHDITAATAYGRARAFSCHADIVRGDIAEGGPDAAP